MFVRAFDPHPDSIIRLLERRDTFTPSDMIWLFIDSYHDRRTGYEFGVNAAGVKIDQAIYNDGNEDGAWDAVWDVATRIDSLGWTAEFRIPLSQMRYSTDRNHTFGFTIDRDIYRYNERVSWPAFSQSKAGMASQFGTLEGMDDLETPRRLEAMPYLVTKNASQIDNNRFTDRSNLTLGGDLKYRVASNVTLDATINPDFGQVEADPAVLNLSAYESFFDERRPFFVAGRGLFRFDVNCNNVNCTSEGLYYSRRIGRTPELAGTYGDTVPQQPTTILGAAKLIGRFPNGLTFGVLDATTQRETTHGRHDVRAGGELRGRSRCSRSMRERQHVDSAAMMTAVNREQGPMDVAISRVGRVRRRGGFPPSLPVEHVRSLRARSTRAGSRAARTRSPHSRPTRCITSSVPTPAFRSIPTKPSSAATPRNSSSIKSAASI